MNESVDTILAWAVMRKGQPYAEHLFSLEENARFKANKLGEDFYVLPLQHVVSSEAIQQWRDEAERLACAAFGAGMLGAIQWGMMNLEEMQRTETVRMPITKEWTTFLTHLSKKP